MRVSLSFKFGEKGSGNLILQKLTEESWPLIVFSVFFAFKETPAGQPTLLKKEAFFLKVVCA